MSAKWEAANDARARAQRAVWQRRKARGYVPPTKLRKVLARTEVWVPPYRFVGRVLIALSKPMTPAELASACTATVDDLLEHAPLFRPHIETMQIGDELIVYERQQSWADLWDRRVEILFAEIRRLDAAGVDHRVIAERFGVQQSTVWRITRAPQLRKAS